MSAQREDPYLDSGMHGYILNTARKEFWRVAAWYDDVADLVQDGYLCYAKCRRRYVEVLGTLPADDPTPDDRRQMMAAVKVAFNRYIQHNIASSMWGGYEVPVSQLTREGADEAADPWEGLTPAQMPEAQMTEFLGSLSSELQQLVVVLARDGVDALRMGQISLERRVLPGGSVRYRRMRRRVRETTNRYYCRLVGCNPREVDLVGQLQALAGSDT